MHVYAGVLAYYRNNILFIQEENIVDEAKSNKWAFPGGSVESDDLAYEAAREFDEETYGVVVDRKRLYERLLYCNYYDDGRIRIYYLDLESVTNETFLNCISKSFLNVYSFLNSNCVNYGKYKAIITNNDPIYLETQKLQFLNYSHLENNMNLLRHELRRNIFEIISYGKFIM